MALQVGLGDIIAVLALLLSVYATWKTQRFRRQEVVLVELQTKINDLVLKKEEREAARAETADLGANLVTLGTKSHRLRIFNRGPETALNVEVQFPDGNDLVLVQDVQEKFPLPAMERGQSVDLMAAVSMGSARRLTVELSWATGDGRTYKKTVHVTL